VNRKELQARIEGTVTNTSDSHYESLRRATVWNRLVPDRFPRLIVQAAGEHDVVEAVKFARANQMKVSLRGGGHSWVGFSLRDDSLLIDLGRMTKASIDRQACRAVVQPAINGGELGHMLDSQGLAFPVGHCPSVPMSGYILSGGIGWNSGEWGPACFSVDAARVVTADGNLVVASGKENSDLLWAIRGGGPGFFAVITEYTLKVFPRPKSITSSSYYYPVDRIEEVGEWAGAIARKLPRQVEFAITIGTAPPSIADRCESSNGFCCIVNALAFADSRGAGASMLAVLDTCPAMGSCLHKDLNVATTMDTLNDAQSAILPEHHRNLADTLWINSAPGEVLAIARDHFLSAPSSKSWLILLFATGNRVPFPNCAYSTMGDALLYCDAVWDQPENDAANRAWHKTAIAALDKFAVGHYIGESDIVADPNRAARSFSPAKWQRLNALRRKYNPEGLFLGHFET
jgi:FAD/FMN-containing dehydrogenase